MRRWLGLSVEQAEALPAWEYRLYLEEILKDKPWVQYVVMVEEPEEEAVGADADSLAELGMTVRQID